MGKIHFRFAMSVMFSFDNVHHENMKRKINFLVKLHKNNNSVSATVAVEHAADDL